MQPEINEKIYNGYFKNKRIFTQRKHAYLVFAKLSRYLEKVVKTGYISIVPVPSDRD